MKNTHAIVQYAGDDFFVATPPSGHAITIDFNGERSAAPGPLELLLVALGGCTGADVVSVLRKKREKLTSYRIEIHGERREEHPKSFRRMEVKHILHGRALSADAVKQAIDLSDHKYCSVAATLRPTVEIVTSYEIHEALEQ
ncbi:MAG: OsmC family protein [Acidobacteriia bacterium]|nr:OsmC family protein [Terriglobia bacterium]